jgi:hypothetical protein
MEERWDSERDDPEVVALLEAFLVNQVWGTRNRFSRREFYFSSGGCFLTIILNFEDYLRLRTDRC